MIDGNELLKRFLRNSIERPVDEAHIDELIKVFEGVLHFYRCLQGYPIPYHDISQFIYNYKLEIRIDDLDILMDAIETKLVGKTEETSRCFRKFRRNISLAVTQKYYIQKVANDALNTARTAEEIANKASNISGKANEALEDAKRAAKKAGEVASNTQKLAIEATNQIKDAKKSSETMMVNYVTILGIFATIIITVFGGINIIGSAVKLLEGNNKLTYLVFVVSFLMVCLLTLVRTLTSWISALNSFKEDKVIITSPRSFYKNAISWFLALATIAGVSSYLLQTNFNSDDKEKDTDKSQTLGNVVFINNSSEKAKSISQD